MPEALGGGWRVAACAAGDEMTCAHFPQYNLELYKSKSNKFNQGPKISDVGGIGWHPLSVGDTMLLENDPVFRQFLKAQIFQNYSAVQIFVFANI